MRLGRCGVVTALTGALLGGCGSSSPSQGGTGGSVGAGGALGAGGTAAAGSTGAAGTRGTAGSSGGSGAAGATGAAGTKGAAGATGAAGGEGGTAFSVAALPGLALWLDAGKGVTATGKDVSLWKDQSSNGNDATSTGSSPPQLVTAAVNGLPAIEFDGTGAYLSVGGSTGVPTLGFGTGQFLIEVVAQWTDSTDFSYFLQMISNVSSPSPSLNFYSDMSNATAVFLLPSSVDNGVVVIATSPPNLGDGTMRVLGAHRKGTGSSTTLEFRINGTVNGMLSGVRYDPDLGSLATAQIGPGMALEIAELVVVTGSTSAGDLASLETYLATKYGL